MQAIYDKAAAENSAIYAAFSFEQWREYLISHGLAAVTETDASITEAGRQFLLYITQQGLPERAL